MRQRIVSDLDELAGVLRQVAALGEDCHDRLTDKAHLAASQRQDRCGVVACHAGDRLERNDGVGYVLRGEHRSDAGLRGGNCRVDQDDTGVRMVATAEGDVQHALHLAVIHKDTPAGEQTGILGAPDPGADILRSRLPVIDGNIDSGVRACVSHKRALLCAGSPTVLDRARAEDGGAVLRVVRSSRISAATHPKTQVLPRATYRSREARRLTASAGIGN